MDEAQSAPSHVLYRAGAAGRVRAARAAGVYIYDTAGRRYLDGSSGPLASNLGHSVPEIVAAIEAQLHRMTFAHGSTFGTDIQERAAALVTSFAPPELTRVFFVSGGSEAAETAIKLARQYWVRCGPPRQVQDHQQARELPRGDLRRALPLRVHRPPCTVRASPSLVSAYPRGALPAVSLRPHLRPLRR